MKYTEKEIDSILELYHKDISPKNISEMLSINHRKVQRICSKSDYRQRTPVYSVDTKNEIISMYKSGLNCTEICAIKGIKVGTMQPWIRDAKIMRHRGPKSLVRHEDFFREIDTEEKAYFLGFLMADGGITIDKNSNQKRLKITLQYCDRAILEKLKESLNADYKISYYERGYNKAGELITEALLTISCNALCDDLINLGIIPRKTGKKSFPKNDIPKHLRRHFVRGFFDGDGITGINKSTKRYCSGFIGNIQIINDIIKETEIKPPSIIQVKNTPFLYTIYFGRKQSTDLWHYMYDNATILLERKKKRMDEIAYINE